MSHQKPRLISLFSGAGCFDIGFEVAGFKLLAAIDSDTDSCKTVAMNRNSGTRILNSPIEHLDPKLLPKFLGLKKRELEVLIGGPPCQPFSPCANGSLGTPLGFEDERSETIHDFFKIVESFLPKAFVIENVPQLISGKNAFVKDLIKRKIYRINSKNKTNYKLSFCRVNTAWYGVPQLRDRIFIIGSRDGLEFQMPSIRFFEKIDSDQIVQQYRNCWDAIGHLAKIKNTSLNLQVKGKWGHLLPSIPPGSNYHWHTRRGGGKNVFEWRTRYWNFLLKLHPLLPSWTIAANPGPNTGPFHWDSRRLNVKELQLLQTVPENYKFSGSLSSVRRQIGNGVPSAIGELIGKEIRSQLLNERVSSKNLKLIPPNKTNTRIINKFGLTE